MEKKRLWLSYWRKQKKTLGIIGLCIAVFMVVFFLYQFPAEAAAYGGFICLCLVILMEIKEYSRYKAHYDKVQRIKEEMVYGTQEFPETQDAVELEYQELVQTLLEKKGAQDAKREREHREMEEYYTTWVHQIKTPIAAMHLLLKEDTGQDQEILEQLFRIEQYVDMVLQYVRLGGKSTDYQIRECELDGIIRRAIRKYARLFIRKKIALEYEGVAVKAVTDEKWLLFVIEQLLSNALKYTNKGKIRIYLLNEKKKELVIEDTGIGISSQDLPRVFESGYTGYNGRKEQRSTGIGLYLCKRVMQQLSHTIRIESEVGKGTRVILRLETITLDYE